MAEGGMTCVKYVLFAFNFLFVLIGSLFIYGGVYIIQDQQAIQSVREIIDTPNTIAIASIVLGLLIFLIAFLGCCGALFESHCILMTFGFIVCVILALELTVAGLAFAFKSDLRNIASRELKIAVEQYNWTEPTAKYSVIVNTCKDHSNVVDSIPHKTGNSTTPTRVTEMCCLTHAVPDPMSMRVLLPTITCGQLNTGKTAGTAGTATPTSMLILLLLLVHLRLDVRMSWLTPYSW